MSRDLLHGLVGVLGVFVFCLFCCLFCFLSFFSPLYPANAAVSFVSPSLSRIMQNPEIEITLLVLVLLWLLGG